jgi:purine-binding chemotaxis protein CheW
MSRAHVHFRVGAEEYALPVEHVLEVAEVGSISPVPGAPEPVLGVRNLHGQVLPVVDLAPVLGMERRGDRSRLLVAEEAGRRAGLVVDDVLEVGELLRGSGKTELDLGAVFTAVEAGARA